jgi:hypothetical protein
MGTPLKVLCIYLNIKVRCCLKYSVCEHRFCNFHLQLTTHFPFVAFYIKEKCWMAFVT